jgi:Bacterial aa3 type cytochrome c oxidase subunit IV
MSDYEHGKMDIATQEKTFAGFVKFWMWLFGFAAFVLLFLAVFNT